MRKSTYIWILVISIILLAYPIYTLINNSEWTSVVLISFLIVFGLIGTYRLIDSTKKDKPYIHP